MIDRLIAWFRYGTIRCPYCHKKAKWFGKRNERGAAYVYYCPEVECLKMFIYFRNPEDDVPKARYFYMGAVWNSIK